jgi:hypothetical protein
MGEDDTLFSWLRYYVILVGAFVLLGVGAAALYLGLGRNEFEAWSTVVEDGFRIPPRQVGAVAEAIFRSEAVYGPAMASLGIEESPRSFLTSSADIRPVPETNVVIIIGRAEDSQRAREISAAMADSFVEAIGTRIEISNFTVFDEARTVPVRGEVSVPVGLSIGGASALWLALGAALLHYRLKRPVLAVDRAQRIVGATRVTSLDGSWPKWLGIFRPKLTWQPSQSNGLKLALLASDNAPPPLVSAPGESDYKLQFLARRLPEGWLLHGFHPAPVDSVSHEDAPTIVVAHAGTNEVDLKQTASLGGGQRQQRRDTRGRFTATGRPRPRSVELLWIR